MTGLGILAAVAIAMLVLVWVVWTFAGSEGFRTYWTLAFMAALVLQVVARHRKERREAEGAAVEAPPAPPRSETAPAPATRVPAEVLVEWDDPLPNRRPHDLDAGADPPEGGLFTEGFTPDVPVRPAFRSSRRR